MWPLKEPPELTCFRNTRNWRWHKKLQVWLTKDDLMVPQALGPTHERGYYIVWDAANWRKERVWAPSLFLDTQQSLCKPGTFR